MPEFFQRLRGAGERPERDAVDASDHILGDTVATHGPDSEKLAGDVAVEDDRLEHPDARALLELDKPLPALARPDACLACAYAWSWRGAVLERDLRGTT